MVQLVNALGRPEPNPISVALIQWIQEQEDERRRDYDRFVDYYRGRQRVKLTDRIRRILPSDLEFTDNFCEVVVDALAERLKVSGFHAKDEAIGEFAAESWRVNRMDHTQNVVHTEAAMKGDSFVLVDWDGENARPRYTYQPPELVCVRYDPVTGRITMASKKWMWEPDLGQEPIARLNLYYPDRVEKYRARNGNWERYSDPGDAVWPVLWLDRQSRPLGVPIIHFRNRPASDQYGHSELTGVIPLQDLLNKTLVDLTQVADVMAFRQRWILNVKAPPDGWGIQPGAVWVFSADDEKAAVGEFGASDPAPLLAHIEMLVQHIAGRSRTPQHLFHTTGMVPSGEALKTAESGIVQKAKLRQVGLGNSWEDCVRMAWRVQNTFGEAVGGDPDNGIETLWEDPETRNEKSHLEGLALKSQLGVPHRQLWREMGYSQEEIDQMEQDIEDQQVRETNIGAAILDNFQRGRGQGQGRPTAGGAQE